MLHLLKTVVIATKSESGLLFSHICLIKNQLEYQFSIQLFNLTSCSFGFQTVVQPFQVNHFVSVQQLQDRFQTSFFSSPIRAMSYCFVLNS